MRLFFSIFITVFIIILTGCKEQPVSEDKFIKVYTDLIIAQDTANTAFTLDEVKRAVFAKYKVTDEDYNNTFKYYNENPERWEIFFDKAIAYLESQRNKSHR